MAASFPRPDPSSPASIAEANFNTSRRGYSTDEVKAFLKAVSVELQRLQERERQLQGELALAKSQEPQVADLDDEAMTRIVGDETVRVLQTARESASLIRIRAEENAARLVSEANDEVNRMRQEIDLEISRKRKDSISDAEAEVAMAKQQGREMVNEARAYRERVLSDLDRRTKLARHQIEELAHGRDRLLQVFERARLVAVDVTSELQALDGPTELVNLAPTTGPLPLMVPRRPLSSVEDEPTGDATAALQVPDIYDAADEPLVDDVNEHGVPDVEADLSNIVDSADAAEFAVADDTVVAEFPDTVNVVLAAESEESDKRDELSAERVDASAPVEELGDEIGDDDLFDSGEDDVVEPSSQRHDGNVVSLFRGRAPESADPAEHADEDLETSDGTTETTDVKPRLTPPPKSWARQPTRQLPPIAPTSAAFSSDSAMRKRLFSLTCRMTPPNPPLNHQTKIPRPMKTSPSRPRSPDAMRHWCRSSWGPLANSSGYLPTNRMACSTPSEATSQSRPSMRSYHPRKPIRRRTSQR